MVRVRDTIRIKKLQRQLRPLASIVIIALGGCGTTGEATRSSDPSQSSAPVVGRPVPDLQLNPLHGGKAMRLGELKGKVVLLDVWASWCAPCKEELPMLDDMAVRLRS